MAPPDAPPPDAAADERSLVEGLLAGDPGVLRGFLARTHHPVWCLACRVTLDRDERRDWTHNALLGVLEDLRQGRFEYRHPGGFWSWFRKRAYFRLLDERRRAAALRRREVPGENPDTVPDLSAFGAGADPARELEGAELVGAVEDCLERVPHRDQRRALRLLLHEELSYQAIADVLEAPLNSVRVWILRGRAVLRQCLARRWGLLGPGEESRA
jgi:RNA polymerase sigma-70 factor, ECF subfamily